MGPIQKIKARPFSPNNPSWYHLRIIQQWLKIYVGGIHQKMVEIRQMIVA
jgi:hypothetical protein